MKYRAPIDREKLVRIREERMSRPALAAAVDYSEKQIYNLESGKDVVSERLVKAVLRELGIERKDIEIKETNGKRRRAS